LGSQFQEQVGLQQILQVDKLYWQQRCEKSEYEWHARMKEKDCEWQTRFDTVLREAGKDHKDAMRDIRQRFHEMQRERDELRQELNMAQLEQRMMRVIQP
jgi:hypothetical protein